MEAAPEVLQVPLWQVAPGFHFCQGLDIATRSCGLHVQLER